MRTSRSILSILAILATAAFAPACGDDNGDDDNGGGGAQAECSVPSDLQDTSWVRCVDEEEGLATNTTVQFRCDDIQVVEEAFTAAGCEGDPAFRLTQTYSATFGPEIEGTDGVRALDLTAQTAVVRALNDIGVKLLDAAEFCGVSGWGTGTDVNIYKQPGYQTSGNCPVEAENRPLYYSYKQEGGRLFFPEQDPATVPENRPTQVSDEGFTQATF